MSRIFKDIDIDAVDQEVMVNGNQFLQVDIAVPESGSHTTGTLTFTAKAPGAAEFSAVTGASIDLASPEHVTIQQDMAEFLSFTVTGYTGDAPAVRIVLNDWGVVRG